MDGDFFERLERRAAEKRAVIGRDAQNQASQRRTELERAARQRGIDSSHRALESGRRTRTAEVILADAKKVAQILASNNILPIVKPKPTTRPIRPPRPGSGAASSRRYEAPTARLWAPRPNAAANFLLRSTFRDFWIMTKNKVEPSQEDKAEHKAWWDENHDTGQAISPPWIPDLEYYTTGVAMDQQGSLYRYRDDHALDKASPELLIPEITSWDGPIDQPAVDLWRSRFERLTK